MGTVPAACSVVISLRGLTMMFGKSMNCFLKNKSQRPASCTTAKPPGKAKVPNPVSLKQQIRRHNKRFGTFK